MNGIHDMGGTHGHGPVRIEPDEPVFHADWEGRVVGIVRCLAYTRAFHMDEFRDAQERLAPDVYLTASYYQRWVLGIERNAVEAGLVSEDELAHGRSLHAGRQVERVLALKDADVAFARGVFSRPVTRAALFAPGDHVRTRNIHPAGHTRLPRYARDHVGLVEAVRGFHAFPDSVVAGRGEDPQWLYTVVFDGREVWGEAADPTLRLSIEAFEPYLERA